MTSFDILKDIENKLQLADVDLTGMDEVIVKIVHDEIENEKAAGTMPEFFKWVTRVYKPFEDIELSSKDEILSYEGITEAQKKERYDALCQTIETLYPQTLVEFYVRTFSSDYLAVASPGLTKLVLENYDSEEIYTTIGALRTKSKTIPLMIQDPSLSSSENFKMFDKTSIIGVVARNIIDGNYVFDMALLVRWLKCAYIYGMIDSEITQAVPDTDTESKIARTRLACYKMLFSEGEGSFYNRYAKDSFKDFFNGRTYTTDLGEVYEEGYITSRDNRYKKRLKRDILDSYSSLFHAFISTSIIDFSFFTHAIEFIYVLAEWTLDYPHNFNIEDYVPSDYYEQRYNRIDVFKKFVEDTKLFYKSLTEYTENVISLTP